MRNEAPHVSLSHASPWISWDNLPIPREERAQQTRMEASMTRRTTSGSTPKDLSARNRHQPECKTCPRFRILKAPCRAEAWIYRQRDLQDLA